MASEEIERLVTPPAETGLETRAYVCSETTSHFSSHDKFNNYRSTSTDILSTVPGEADGSEGDGQGIPGLKQSPVGIMSLLLIGVAIASADSTLVLATYGTIASEFNALSQAAWLTTSYALAQSAIQPLCGKVSDIFGRKSILLISYGLFTIGCIICGISHSMAQVILGRIITGLGAAGMQVIVSILITDLVPMRRVASYRSFVNVVATLGRSLGGPIGGILSDTIGWRYSFSFQAPLLLVAMFLIAFKMPSLSRSQGVTRKGQPSKLRRIDFVGAGLLAGCIVMLLGGMSIGGVQVPWSHPFVTGLFAGAVVIGVLFVIWEERWAEEPIFPPSLVIRRDVATSYAIQALQMSGQVAMMYSVPLYFRVTQFASNTVAGTHLFPAVVGNTAGALLSGYIIDRTGHYKLLTILASFCSSSSYLLLYLRWHGHTNWLESLYIIPGGFGTGIIYSSSMIALVASIPASDIAIATSGLYLAGGVGMLFGVAASSSVQTTTLKTMLSTASIPPEIIRRVSEDVSVIPTLEEGVRSVVVNAFVESLGMSYLLSFGCTLMGLTLAFTMREHLLK